MKKTLLEMIEIDNMVGGMYTADPALKNTKFGYAYKRYAEKSFYPVIKSRTEEMTSVRIDHALIDPVTKAVLFDETTPRGFRYDKAGLKAVIKAEKDFIEEYDKREFEVTPYIVKAEDLPKLTKEQKDALKDILV